MVKILNQEFITTIPHALCVKSPYETPKTLYAQSIKALIKVSSDLQYMQNSEANKIVPAFSHDGQKE